jgi:DNA-binding Lrp family transcriptional regulator
MDVFMKLVGKFIDQRDIFLLFGPVDILIRFNKVESIEEFTQKWFNPIRLMGADEDLITKTLSFITITKGPEISTKPFAFVFFNTKPKNLETVREKLLKIPEVLSADSVFGPFDLITSVKVQDQVELETLVLLMQQIIGVENTTTSVVAGANLLPDY